MTREKYLRICGVVEIIFTVIGIIYGLIVMIGATAGSTWAASAAGGALVYGVTGFALFITWVVFLFACFLAPAFGVALLAIADLCGEVDSLNYAKRKEVGNSNQRMKKLEEKVLFLENKIKLMNESQSEEQ